MHIHTLHLSYCSIILTRIINTRQDSYTQDKNQTKKQEKNTRFRYQNSATQDKNQTHKTRIRHSRQDSDTQDKN